MQDTNRLKYEKVMVMTSVQLIDMMKEMEGSIPKKIAHMTALKHIMHGAMDGATNKEYIKATNNCYKMLKDLIEEHYK